MRGFPHLLRLLFDERRGVASLDRIRARRFRSLVKHAYDEVPYYRDLFRSANLTPDDVESPDDIGRIPVTPKEVLRSLKRDAKVARSCRLSACRRVTTSGSTGTPLEIFFTPSDHSVLSMTWVRAMLAHGMRPRESRLQIIGPHNISVRRNWYTYLGYWKTYGISALRTPEDWLGAWRNCRSDVLWAYSGSLRLLAQHVLRQRIDDVRPRLVFGVSDSVDPECRDLVRAAFGTRLIDLYGTAEAGLVGWECPRCDGYHVNSDTLIVEFLDGNGPVTAGTPGRVVVTNLYSSAMPVLRYAIGDVGVPSGTSPLCGRRLPLMASVLGRDDDCIVLPSGRVLSPMFAFCVMKTLDGVNRFRILQGESGQLTVLVIPEAPHAPDLRERVARRWQMRLAEDLRTEVAIVDALPATASGKNRCTISERRRGQAPSTATWTAPEPMPDYRR